MGLLPESRRGRRRLAWLAAVVVVAGGVAAAVALLPTRSSSIAPERFSAQPPVTESTPPTVRLTARDRDAIDRTLAAFVRDAARRLDVAAAYDLVTPALRAGQSRAEWDRGGIPVTPYPGQVPRRRAWTLRYSYPGDVGLDLLLQPLPGAKVGPISFRTELKRIGGRWRVEVFYPVASFSRPDEKARIQAEPDLAPHQEGSATKGRLSPLWLLVPGVALVALVLASPVLLAVLAWRRRVRAERAYREFVAERGG
jgi:hypothetical protein